MIVATYDQWREKKLEAALRATNKKDRYLKCDDCSGTGEVECDCCGHEKECERCDGHGKLDAKDFYDFKPPQIDYFNEVIADAKVFCAWCNRDFLGEIGPFIKEFRGCA